MNLRVNQEINKKVTLEAEKQKRVIINAKVSLLCEAKYLLIDLILKQEFIPSKALLFLKTLYKY